MNDRATDNLLQDVRIFVVDDEDLLAWSLETEFKSLGAEVMRANSMRQAIDRLPRFNPDVVVSDLRLPDGNGIELLKKWRIDYPDLPVILITAHGAIDSAITALRHGAFDYLQKPFEVQNLIASIKRGAEMGQLRQKVGRMAAPESGAGTFTIIGDDDATVAMRARLLRVAKSKVDTVLITGETGTGKELAARAVHFWSDRSKGPFMEINCASIPETLLESELFGYEKGAFTDAKERKLGLLEIARNGTIFLDEIGELAPKVQSKLLRALEYRRFKRLGGTKDIEFTGRIVAATNRNLIEEVAHKRFRDDLFYRLNVISVKLPSLRARKGDIKPLVDFFLTGLAEELGLPRCDLGADALEVLKEHDWPGNIRELRNTIKRAMVLHEPKVLHSEHIELDVVPEHVVSPDRGGEELSHARTEQRQAASAAPTQANSVTRADGFRLPEEGIQLEEVEKDLLIQALERSRYNQTKAAVLLGISRHTLRYRLEKYGLDNT